jgi:membrane protein
MVSLALHALIDLLYERLTHIFADGMIVIFIVINYVVLFVVISILFAIVFKVLPDAKIKWRDALAGASFTAVLFLIGKSLIGLYVSNSSIGVTYGTAASIIIILLWVYYSSIILFIGAEFTKVYTLNFGSGIVPSDTAVFIIKQESKEIHLPNKDLTK